VQTLAHAEGLLCELTTAVVIAALEQNTELFRNQSVACILTGHGLKDLAGKPIKDSVAPPHIPPELEALEGVPAMQDWQTGKRIRRLEH